MRGRIAPKWRDARYTVRVDFVIGVNRESWIRESDSEGRADEG